MPTKIYICKECGLHGNVISLLGILSPEFCSKEQAKNIVDSGIDKELLLSEDRDVMMQQIQKSILPETDDLVPPDWKRNLEIWNEMNMNWDEMFAGVCMMELFRCLQKQAQNFRVSMVRSVN